MIRDETLDHYLHRLASGRPTPGGGATGALAVAQGAGLTAMAARFSGAERTARACEDVLAVCLRVADADERGFGAVADAYAMPADTDDERTARSEAVQAALATAVRPPRQIVDAVEDLLGRVGEVLADANPNVLSDLGAALGCARGGLTAAVMTLLTDLAPLQDDGLTAQVRQEVSRADALTERIDATACRVRERIVG